MRLTLLTVLVLLSQVCFGQYKYVNKLYVDDFTYPKNFPPYGRVKFKGIGEKVRMYTMLDSSTIIKEIQLNNLTVVRIDTVNEDISQTNVTDIAVTPKYDVLVGLGRLNIYNRQTHQFNYIKYDTVEFRHAYAINDSVLLLYYIGNLHPMDGFSGAQFHLYNLNSKRIIKTRKYTAPGTSISHMTVNWFYTDRKKIYEISPFTGEMKCYNMNLELENKYQIPYAWKNIDLNKKFQDSIDNYVNSEWTSMHERIVKLGKDSVRRNRQLISSPVYAKEFVVDVSKRVRSDFEFMEKIIPFNDSVFIITVSQPGYEFDYRDLVFYNFKTNKCINKISKWRCSPADTVKSFEDFFVVDVINDSPVAPYFDNGKIYFPTIYNVNLFVAAPSDTLRKRLFLDSKKNSFHWKLLEYKFN